MKKQKVVYYRPSYYFDDGTNISCGGAPEELADNEVFETKKDCREWLIDNDYNPNDYTIQEFDKDDFDDEIVIL